MAEVGTLNTNNSKVLYIFAYIHDFKKNYNISEILIKISLVCHQKSYRVTHVERTAYKSILIINAFLLRGAYIYDPLLIRHWIECKINREMKWSLIAPEKFQTPRQVNEGKPRNREKPFGESIIDPSTTYAQFKETQYFPLPLSRFYDMMHPTTCTTWIDRQTGQTRMWRLFYCSALDLFWIQRLSGSLPLSKTVLGGWGKVLHF